MISIGTCLLVAAQQSPEICRQFLVAGVPLKLVSGWKLRKYGGSWTGVGTFDVAVGVLNLLFWWFSL